MGHAKPSQPWLCTRYCPFNCPQTRPMQLNDYSYQVTLPTSPNYLLASLPGTQRKRSALLVPPSSPFQIPVLRSLVVPFPTPTPVGYPFLAGNYLTGCHSLALGTPTSSSHAFPTVSISADPASVSPFLGLVAHHLVMASLAPGMVDPTKAGKYPVILSDELLGKPSHDTYTGVQCKQAICLPSRPSRPIEEPRD